MYIYFIYFFFITCLIIFFSIFAYKYRYRIYFLDDEKCIIKDSCFVCLTIRKLEKNYPSKVFKYLVFNDMSSLLNYLHFGIYDCKIVYIK